MAAVVGFVLFHPWSVPPYFVAFSSVDWKGIPKPKAAPVSEKRAGVVIVWKDFDKQPSQGEVDSLYLAVAPSMEVYERIGVVSPKALKDFAQRGGTVPGDRESLLKWLRTELDMNMVVLVTISRRGEGRSVQTELIDTASGAVLARKTEEAYAEAELPARIRESVMNLLLLAGQAGGSDGKP
jgi:hypothetical protein